MASSYTYTCYLIDVSPSMGQPLDLEDPTSKTRLEYALEFVRIKIAQRLYNPKATDQIALVLFGGKTVNQLADQDGYENIHEAMAMHQPSYADIRALDAIKLGHTDVDLISALYVAGNLVRNAKVARKDAKKQVILLTDAEEPKNKDSDDLVRTAWDDKDWLEPLYGALVPGLGGAIQDPKTMFTLGIIGMDFGEPDLEEQTRSTWSKEKHANVQGLTDLFTRVNTMSQHYPERMPRVIMGSITSAIQGAGAPSVTPIVTTRKKVELIIGDPDVYPEQSMKFAVEVQKATQKGSAKSMQKMKRGAWDKKLTRDQGNGQSNGSKKRRRDDDDEGNEQEDDDDDDRTTYHEPGTLIQEKQWFYVSENIDDPAKPKADKKAREEDDSDDEAGNPQRSAAARRLENADNISRAYKYGADLLPVSKDEEDEFYRFPAGEPGLIIRGFVKASKYQPKLALNDPYWVFGGSENRSQLALSGLLWAMKEMNVHALVRLLLPGSTGQPQPRVCLLIPRVGEDAVTEGMEMGLLVQMPFKEESANWSFPSLDRIHTVTGRPVTEHRLLPKEDLLEAMDSFTDSMMLPMLADEETEASGQPDEDVKPETNNLVPWFDPNQAYNPAIHNMRNCIIHKLLHPDKNMAEGDEMEVHPMLTQYLFPPDQVMETSASAAASLSKAANLALIPPKPKVARGKGAKTKQARKAKGSALQDLLGDEAADEEEVEGSNAMAGPSGFSQSQNLYRHNASFSQNESQPASPARKKNNGKSKLRKQNDDGSATEGSDTDDGEDAEKTMDIDEKEDSGKGRGKQTGKPSLISRDQPVQDFEKLVAQGGHMTSLAVKQFLDIIPEFIDEAETQLQYAKPIKCIKSARKAALEQDEATEYNDFLHKLKQKLYVKGARNSDFFYRLKREDLGLVTEEEGPREEGEPPLDGSVTVSAAEDFWLK